VGSIAQMDLIKLIVGNTKLHVWHAVQGKQIQGEGPHLKTLDVETVQQANMEYQKGLMECTDA